MHTKSKVKEEFPELEDLMFKNSRAISRNKRKKYFEKVKPLKFRKWRKRN